jgi:Tol biopolymer transport system component
MNKLVLSAVCLSCTLSALFAQPRPGSSILEIIDVANGNRKTVKTFPHIIEAPNWTSDGKWLVYNSEGKLYRISPDSKGEPQEINTGFATACNNDHVLSADGKQIAISHGTHEDRKSRIYTLPFAGGNPTLITPMAPSYLHGWSPDGKYLAYCAERNSNYDVYIIPATGGVEVRLTDAEGLDDGPEYSPDGKYIWFNSVRTGLMQVWRMKTDGTEPTQMTFHQNLNSWFPHVSPDGRQVVYICYSKDDVAPGAHPPNKNVEFRIMPADGGESRLLAKLFGGQGSLNVNSWSPDSKKLAFVSYSLNAEQTFNKNGDIGKCALAGKTVFDKTTGAYSITGSGENMWGNTDAFQYAWIEHQGDFTLTADVAFEGEGVNAHRKAGIRISESLDDNAQCVFVAIHGDGLSELQYREKKGEEIKNKVSENRAPTRIQLSRKGNTFTMKTWYNNGNGQIPAKADAELSLEMPGKCFLGLYVCSHDNSVSETARFSNVEFRHEK